MVHCNWRLILGLAVLAIFSEAGSARSDDGLPPVPTPARSFNVGTLRVDEFGKNGHAVVLIPGLAEGPWVWSRTIAALSPQFTVYVITLPGFDGRPAATLESLFATFSHDFWEMLHEQKIEKPVLIGHSLGGTLAISLGEQHSDRLAGIVAADGMPVFPSFANSTTEQRKKAATQMAQMYVTMAREAELEAMKSYMRAIGTNKSELVEPTARLLARSDPKAIAAWTQEDIAVDLRPNLDKLTVPLLVLVPYDASEAAQYGMTTAKQKSDFYKEILKGAPHATIVPISPSLHFMMLDQPDTFNTEISKFLKSIWSDGASR